MIIPVLDSYPNFIEDAKRWGLAAKKTVLMVRAFVVGISSLCRHNSKFFGPSFDYKDYREILKIVREFTSS